jgi:hypothetical protein
MPDGSGEALSPLVLDMNPVGSDFGKEQKVDDKAPTGLANTLRTLCAKEARWEMLCLTK